MNKWVEVLIGIILLVISVYVWGMNILGAGTAALSLLKGGMLWLIILVGLIFVILGINDLKE